VAAYKGSWLDELCMSGDVAWGRLATRKGGDNGRSATTSSATPISLVRRTDLSWLLAGIRSPQPNGGSNSSAQLPSDSPGSWLLAPSSSITGAGRDILDLLSVYGALFYDDIASASGRLPTDVERGLWDLVARGLITRPARRRTTPLPLRRRLPRPRPAREHHHPLERPPARSPPHGSAWLRPRRPLRRRVLRRAIRPPRSRGVPPQSPPHGNERRARPHQRRRPPQPHRRHHPRPSRHRGPHPLRPLPRRRSAV